MSIISKNSLDEISKLLYESYRSKLDSYTSPNTSIGSTYDFLDFMEVISRESEEFVR